MRTEYAGLVDAKFIGRTVTLFGWVHRRRDHGGVIFIDLRDREGLVQVVCDPDAPETFKTADRLRAEYVICVEGVEVAAVGAVAQVGEYHPAVVAAAVHPAGERHRPAEMRAVDEPAVFATHEIRAVRRTRSCVSRYRALPRPSK